MSAISPETYRQNHPLDVFFAPASVAVVGATEAVGSVGRTVVQNLLNTPFGGSIYPVNRSSAQVLGLAAYPSIAAVPGPVELAVIVTPAASVPEVVGECAAAGVKGAIVISAGFRERGADGAALEAEMLSRAGSMRLIGPNCFGVMCPLTGLNATFAPTSARPGSVAFISQSGALYSAVLDWSLRERVGFSAFISLGSMADVGWSDLISYLGDDINTRSILLYMESVGDARAFLSAAREVALNKPIIVLKAGRTPTGSAAAVAHTGSDTGDDAVLEAAFRRCGVLRVTTINNLFELAEALARHARPAGPRLTIVTNAGGPGVLAADALAAAGGELAPLPPDIHQALDAVLPAHWSHSNPIDMLGDAGPERYAQAIAAASLNPESDGMLIILTPQAMTAPTRVAEVVQTLARTYRKPLLASWMGGDDVASGAAILNQAGIPSFAYPDAAAHHFQTLWRYTQNLRSLYETPGLADDGVDAARRSRATQLIEACRTAGCEPLDAPATHKLLAAYNIPLRRRPPHAGLPLHLSSHPDPQFGPVLRFGVGGPLGSPLNDVAIGLPPLNTTLARRVMEQTRIYRTLHQHVNLDALAALLVRFSQLVAEQRWIESISLDPLLAQGDQIVAAEATVRLYGPDVRETDLPRLAIRPYPSHQVQPWALRDGTPIVMRPIRPEDEPLLVTFHQTVSEKSVYLRYFFPMKLSQRISHERLARISFVDYDRAVVLAAERSDATTGEKTILAVGRLNKLRDGSSGEFAVLVNDAWQGHGLGTELLRRLIAYGKEEGITRIIGHVLPDNRGMQAVARKLGFRLSTGSEGVITAELTL